MRKGPTEYRSTNNDLVKKFASIRTALPKNRVIILAISFSFSTLALPVPEEEEEWLFALRFAGATDSGSQESFSTIGAISSPLNRQSNGSMTPLQLRLVCLHTLFTYCQALFLVPDPNEQAGTSASLPDLGELVMQNYTSFPYNSTGFIPTNSSNLLNLISSQTTSPSNAALVCNGQTYGFNVPLRSCMDAYRQIPDDATDLTFAPRHTVSCDIALPFRWISSDGRCIIDVLIKDSSPSANVSYSELRTAANLLSFHCVNRRSQGGIVTGLGDGLHVDLIMASYVPDVYCEDSPGPPTENCKTIGNSMPATSYEKLWGTAHDFHADITLPRTLLEPGRRCMAMIETLGPTDVSSWYDIWQAVIALDGMCVRNGQVGTARRRGLGGNLFVNISNENSQSSADATA